MSALAALFGRAASPRTGSIVIIFLSVVTLVLGGLPPGTQQKEHVCKGYALGEPLAFQCWNSTGVWGPPPVCLESSAVMSFNYGTDKFQYCSWAVDPTLFAKLKDVSQGHASWNCRVLMAPDHNVWIPLSIPVWAFVELDHIHIDNHINFIFHGDAGKVMGASAYPLRDRFQYLRPGVPLNIHGAVKWFHQGTYLAFHSGRSEAGDVGTFLLVFLWSLITFIATLVCAVGCYRFYMRPRLLRKMLKKD